MSKIISVPEDWCDLHIGWKGDENILSAFRKLAAKKSDKEKILAFFGRGGIDNLKIKELQWAWKRLSKGYM